MPDFIHLAGGARLDPDDAAFPRVAFGYAADPADLPESHYLTVGGRQYQADAGSCVAHGYSAVVESFAAERGAGLQLCRQDIYFGARWVEVESDEAAPQVMNVGDAPELLPSVLEGPSELTGVTGEARG